MSSACLELPDKPFAAGVDDVGGADASASTLSDGGRGNNITDNTQDASAGGNATGRIELTGTTWLTATTITVRFSGVSRKGDPFIAIYSEQSPTPVTDFRIPFVERELVTSGTHAFDPLPIGSYVVRLVYDADQVLREVPFNVRADSDGDRTADDEDGCPSDPEKTSQGICPCGVADNDGDSDGTPDCMDTCPDDAIKIAPGVCGCTLDDDDGDSDGTPDCVDACPGDTIKIAPGVCGCALEDDDSDSDGTADCVDSCPNDAIKIAPGVCGCAMADADVDGDGSVDCQDQCPLDPSKTAPGACGCGLSEGTCLPVDCSSELLANVQLVVGDRRCSQNGKFSFGLGADGTLTLREGSEVLWSAFQTGPAASMKLQGDGNLVVRSAAGAALWHSGTVGKVGAILTVEDNGSVVLRHLGVVVWSIGPFSSGDTRCREARENQLARLTCPSGQTISAIEFASYGKPTGACGSYAVDSTCHYPAQSFVETHCLGDNTCELLVDKADLTIPCTGAKRLVVAYSCLADTCPEDPAKTAPGGCGCGVADDDGDGDGTADCVDACPSDSLKIAPGACGCAVEDTDSDSDGTADCADDCPADSVKIAPGVCGCGIADSDGDNDGTLNCQDQCPLDPNKVAPGACGCGVAEGSCPPPCSHELLPNIAMAVGEQRCSQNGQFSFGLGADGILTLREGSTVIWSAFQTVAAVTLRLQGDGNLVARSATNAAVWSSATAGKNGAVLTVEDNGSVVLRHLGLVVWSIGPFQSGETFCREARENQLARLACPVGQTISAIEFASYGKPTGVCGSYAIESSCHFAAQDFVQTHCVGDSTCEFLVDKADFTIPCTGTKRLVVAYSCSGE